MTLKVVFSGQGQVLHFDVKRPGQDGLIELDIQPRREPGSERPTIGVRPSRSLSVALFRPARGNEESSRVSQGRIGERPPAASTRWSPWVLRARLPAPWKTSSNTTGCSPVSGQAAHARDREARRPPGRTGTRARAFRARPASGQLRRLRFPFDRSSRSAAFRRARWPIKPASARETRSSRSTAGTISTRCGCPAICYNKAGKAMRFEVERTDSDGSRINPHDHRHARRHSPVDRNLSTPTSHSRFPAWDCATR